jgi:fumarylpyruvate hydrolase
MLYVIQKPLCPALPVVGTDDLFPVRRVYCVGRNYAAHAREMGHDPNREPPFFFMKPADALLPVPAGETAELPYPPKTANYHFEVEMVVALGQGGRDIPVEAALDGTVNLIGAGGDKARVRPGTLTAMPARPRR